MHVMQASLRMRSPMTSFTPTVPAALMPVAGALAPELRGDAARVFHELGLQAMRAAVVDLDSAAVRRVWGMSDGSSDAGLHTDVPWDTPFSGTTDLLQQLAANPTEFTVEQRLSPRHWCFAWRLDGERAMLAEVHYHDARAIVGMIDTAMVRVLCDVGVLAGLPAGAPLPLDDPKDGHAPGAQGPRRRGPGMARMASLALAGGSVLLAAWMAFVALPELSAQSTRQQMVVDQAVAQSLALPLASGNFGEVQQALNSAQRQGFFSSAAVTNDANRAVSLAGAGERWRIGDVAPVVAAGRKLELTQGGQRFGTLWLLGGIMQDSDPSWTAMRQAAIALAAAAAGLVLLLLRGKASRRSD